MSSRIIGTHHENEGTLTYNNLHFPLKQVEKQFPFSLTKSIKVLSFSLKTYVELLLLRLLK